jgi:hypothetical protein
MNYCVSATKYYYDRSYSNRHNCYVTVKGDWPCYRIHRSLLHNLIFWVVLLCVFTFWIPCWDVRCDFRIKAMLVSSVPSVVCRRPHVLFRMVVSSVPSVVCSRPHVLFRMVVSSVPSIVCSRPHVLFTLVVFAGEKWYPIHIVLLCFVFLRLVYLMLSVSLNCQFIMSPSVFLNVYILYK